MRISRPGGVATKRQTSAQGLMRTGVRSTPEIHCPPPGKGHHHACKHFQDTANGRCRSGWGWRCHHDGGWGWGWGSGWGGGWGWGSGWGHDGGGWGGGHAQGG